MAIWARGMAFCGTPLGRDTPSTISRSAGLISSSSPAMASTFSLTFRVVTSTAPLAQVAARLPPVPMRLKGVMSGVAVDHPDVVERDPHLVGGHLGERRLVALAVGHLRGDHHQVAVRLELDLGPLAAEARRPRARISSGPGAASMKVANPMPRQRPSVRAAACSVRNAS